MDNYVAVNKANWDSRVPHHIGQYQFDEFRANKDFLSDVVRFDLPRLGEIVGLDVVHLQCHLGTDTLSLARLGAASTTGLDFSPPALAAARDLALECGASINYVESELYDAVAVLGAAQFDLVYTGIGALCWLPDIRRWAQVIADLLRPGGRLFLREGHPVLWSLGDPREDGLLTITYPYFETEGIHFSESQSYVSHDEPLASPDNISFNHGLGQIVSALLAAGMQISALEEHDSAPYNALGDYVSEIGGGEFRLREDPLRLPMTYTLQATKS